LAGWQQQKNRRDTEQREHKARGNSWHWQIRQEKAVIEMYKQMRKLTILRYA
jgi:hypothetical protein